MPRAAADGRSPRVATPAQRPATRHRVDLYATRCRSNIEAALRFVINVCCRTSLPGIAVTVVALTMD
jgi:hypothetical protein